MFEGYGEVMPVEGVAISMRKITAHASNRIARSAFEWARRRRKHVTFMAVGVLQWPLVPVVLGIAPVSIAFAWWQASSDA